MQGVIGSDRWGADQLMPVGWRQLCWAHLGRDFQAMIDRWGAAAVLGEELLFNAEMLFELWYPVRDGTRSRRWLRGQINGWLRAAVRGLLERGSGCGCVKTIGVCAGILKLEPALWTFAPHEVGADQQPGGLVSHRHGLPAPGLPAAL